jgi:hypothetical protein
MNDMVDEEKEGAKAPKEKAAEVSTAFDKFCEDQQANVTKYDRTIVTKYNNSIHEYTLLDNPNEMEGLRKHMSEALAQLGYSKEIVELQLPKFEKLFQNGREDLINYHYKHDAGSFKRENKQDVEIKGTISQIIKDHPQISTKEGRQSLQKEYKNFFDHHPTMEYSYKQKMEKIVHFGDTLNDINRINNTHTAAHNTIGKIITNTENLQQALGGKDSEKILETLKDISNKLKDQPTLSVNTTDLASFARAPANRQQDSLKR